MRQRKEVNVAETVKKFHESGAVSALPVEETATTANGTSSTRYSEEQSQESIC